MVQGLYTVFDGMASTCCVPTSARSSPLREGTLDFVLLKPIDSQFWLSPRTLSPAGLPEIGWACRGDLVVQAGVVLSSGVLRAGDARCRPDLSRSGF